MTTYAWNEPDILGNTVMRTITSERILRDYGPYWRERMQWVGKAHLISDARCIEDFCVVHWAWPLEPTDTGESIKGNT